MKALVLSTNTGGGHNSAAEAVAEALRRRGHSADFRDGLALVNGRVSQVAERAYVSLVRISPRTFGRMYQAGQWISRPGQYSIVYAANTIHANRLYEYIQQGGYDVVVTSHLFCAQAMTHLRRSGFQLPPSIGVMTDYTCAPFWEETELDLYCIPHEALREEYKRHGVSAERTTVTGIPVSPDCQPCEWKDERARRLEPRLLLVGGSMGAGKLDVSAAVLLEALPKAWLTVVCGSNQAVKSELERRYGQQERVRILGYAPLIPLIEEADLIVSKPGGLSSTEIMTIRRPYIMLNPIEGVETINAAFLSRRMLAWRAQSAWEAGRMAMELCEQPERGREMLAAQAREINACASQMVAQKAEELAAPHLPRGDSHGG